MGKRLALIAGVVAAAALAAAPVGAAAKPADPGKGGRCIAAGVGTLVSLGLIDEAARGQLDYAPFDASGAGLIRAELGDSAFLPLSTVIRLHRTSLELFAWCDDV